VQGVYAGATKLGSGRIAIALRGNPNSFTLAPIHQVQILGPVDPRVTGIAPAGDLASVEYIGQRVRFVHDLVLREGILTGGDLKDGHARLYLHDRPGEYELPATRTVELLEEGPVLHGKMPDELLVEVLAEHIGMEQLDITVHEALEGHHRAGHLIQTIYKAFEAGFARGEQSAR
jgi:hypothetical protein